MNCLQVRASALEEDLQTWKCQLALQRDNFYELNYFTTPQLLSLREELGQFKGSKLPARPVKQEVMTLMQSISRELSSDSVKNEVQIVNGILAEQQFLQDKLFTHGKSAQFYSSGYDGPLRLPSGNSSALSMENDPNVFTPAADRQSIENEASEPLARPIAAVLKTPSGPQPKLTDKDLTDKQKAIVYNLKETYGFPTKIIFLAFERCAKPDIQEAVMKWCNENIENFNFSDSDAGSETGTETYEYPEDEEELPSEEEHMETDETRFEEAITLKPVSPGTYSALEEPPIKEAWTEPPPLISHSAYSFHPPASHPTPKVKVVDRVPISEDHPVVRGLIDSGFNLEESLIAAEQHPDNIERAMAFLMEGPSESGELFAPVPYDSVFERHDSIGEYDRQISADSDELE